MVSFFFKFYGFFEVSYFLVNFSKLIESVTEIYFMASTCQCLGKNTVWHRGFFLFVLQREPD